MPTQSRGHRRCPGVWIATVAVVLAALIPATSAGVFGDVGFQVTQKVFYAGLGSLTNFSAVAPAPRPPSPPKKGKASPPAPVSGKSSAAPLPQQNKTKTGSLSLEALRQKAAALLNGPTDQVPVSAALNDVLDPATAALGAFQDIAHPVMQNLTYMRNGTNLTITNYAGPDAWAARYAGSGRYNLSNDFHPAPSPQGCAGADFVISIVNRVITVWGQSSISVVRGRRLTPYVPINQFLNLSPYLTSQGAVPGDSMLQGSCIYDPLRHRFYMSFVWKSNGTSSSWDKFGQTRRGAVNFGSGLVLAASTSYDPRLPWRLFFIPTTNDGQNSADDTAAPLNGQNPPFYNDMPRIGLDASGAYISSTEYGFAGNLVGYNIFGFGKAFLNASADFTGVRVVIGASQVSSRFNNIAPVRQPGDSLLPWDLRFGGTTYFACSTTQSSVAVFTLSNTGSLNSTSPLVTGGLAEVKVGNYTTVSKAGVFQRGPFTSATNPLGIFLGNRPQPRISSDADGTVLSSVSAAVQYGWGGARTKYVHSSVWIAWNIGVGTWASVALAQVTPRLRSDGSLSAGLLSYRILNLNQQSLLYPAIAFNRFGKGVLINSVLGTTFWPTALYLRITSKAIVEPYLYLGGGGTAPLDNKEGYSGAGIAKYGNFQAVDIDEDGNAWCFAEYMEGANQWRNTSYSPFDQLGGWANWGTRIFQVDLRLVG